MKSYVIILFQFFLFTFSFVTTGKSQTFLNGNFEINTAGIDQINLSNFVFNGFMSNTIAYGATGNVDIVTSATYCGLAQNGLWFISLMDNTYDAVTMQLSAPLVAGTSYTISFWDRACYAFGPSGGLVQLGISNTAGVTGTPVYTAPAPTNSVWVQRTTTFVAPVTGLYISVSLTPSGGAGDWTHVDNFVLVPTVALPPISNFTASTTSICEGNCIAFTDASTNTPTSWNWTFPGGTPSTSTLQNPGSVCYATAGSYPVTLSVSNASGADTLVQTSYVTVNAVPLPTISGTTSICSGTTTTLTASGGTTYSWNTGSGLVAISVSPVITTIYTVTASNGGCTATASQTVTVTTAQIATFNYAGPYCQNATDPSPTLGPGASLGTFTSTPGLSINASTGLVDLSLSTLGTYTVTNSFPASGSCPAISATATISINAVPIPVITGTTTICSGATTILTASGGATFSWNTGSGLAATSVSPLVTTTYTVTANNGGCTATASQTVTVTPAPTSTTIDTICAGQSYTLPSGITVVNAGIYNDTLSTTGGCDSIIITNLSVNPALANAGLDTIIPFGGSTILTASGGIGYSWSPSSGLSCTNCANPIATPTQTTTYTLTTTNSNGCTASDIVTVFVDLPPCEGSSVDLKTLIPNAFSPNGDGLNDQLCIPVNPCIVKLSLIIYDRWGEKVYEGISLDQCWDGVYGGKKLDSAVFAYYFTVVFIDGKTGKGKGNISLIK